MKNRLFLPLALMISFASFLTSCNINPENNASSNKIDIKESIAIHKNDQIFLNFWPTMTKKEFEKVRLIENSNGSLRNGQFRLDLPLDDLAFDVSLKDNAIILHHRNEYWGAGSRRMARPNNSNILDSKGSKYRESRLYLKNHFTSKYNRFEEGKSHYPNRTIIFDIENERTIILDLEVYLFEAHKSREPVIFVGDLKWDKKEENARFAYRDFTITYMSSDEYRKRIEERKRRIEEQNNRRDQREKEKEDHNNLL